LAQILLHVMGDAGVLLGIGAGRWFLAWETAGGRLERGSVGK
jgi:hypothetical protein